MNEEHQDENESIEWLGIKKLLEITGRIKQNFDGVTINDEGELE